MTSGRVDVRRGAHSTSWDYVYQEDGRTWRLEWDSRDDGPSAYARFDSWEAPQGETIDASARARILDAVWPIAHEHGGIMGIFDYSKRLRCPLAARWDRGSGFLLDVNDGGAINYYELGRTMRIAYRRSDLYVAVVQWPASPRWCEPDGPVEADDTERIRERLQCATSSDMRYGGHLPWRITLAEGPTP